MNHQRYLNWLLSTTSPAVRSWVGDEVLLASLGDDLSQTIADRIDSVEWGQRYACACPCEGASPEDYHRRELQLSGDLSLLAGIHFCGSAKLFPFVGIYAQSREIAQGELRQVIDFLMGEFALFEPTCVQLWSLAQAGDFPQLEDVHVSGDQRFVIGNLAEIIAGEAPAEPPAETGVLSLEKPVGLNCYQSYREIYEEFFTDYPRWYGRMEIESRESLDECDQCGGLSQVLVDGEFAGLIAAKPVCYRGVPGWLMIDEVLAKPYRGRGIAPTMQRKFIEQLDQGRGNLVMGTIDNNNEPSLRTAMRNGRIDAGGWLWGAGESL